MRTCIDCETKLTKRNAPMRSWLCSKCMLKRDCKAEEAKRAKMREAVCPECGAAFLTNKSQQVYCSRYCASRRQSRAQQGDYRSRIASLRLAHERRGAGPLPTEVRLSAMLDAAIASGHCPYCGEETAEGDWTLDHLVPVSRGGSNRMNNLKFVCHLCNMRKGTSPFDEFVLLSLPHTLGAL